MTQISREINWTNEEHDRNMGQIQAILLQIFVMNDISIQEVEALEAIFLDDFTQKFWIPQSGNET